MSDSVRVWQPMVEGNYKSGLGVPTDRLLMTLPLYQSLLQQRLRDLILADPAAAKRLLSDSPENHPDLSQISTETVPEALPSRIMMCDQMQMLLGQISPQQGQIVSMDPCDLPSLQELIENL